MKKINLSNLTPQSVTAFCLSVISIINIVLPMIGYSPVDVDNELIYNTISVAFLIGTTLYSMYRNFNITDASVKSQEILDLLKNGTLLIEDIDEIIDTAKGKNSQ